jgi:hypothetical protein
VLGLLPAGLSAEHLGVSDHYFWDNFWSAAGLRAFLRLCDLTGNSKDRDFFTRELSEYEEAIENAVARAQKQHGIREIPASPRRTVDNGMIGSCCAWYPLQYYSPDDLRMATTLETLSRMFVRNGMFFQEFIHSGLNAYLTLHVAHAWLYAGNRRAFWDLLQSVICRSSPTGNFPEAIHPLTGGGCMGDGHHGWAAAEVALAVRDAFVQEFWKPGKPNHDLVLLGGIPAAWFYRNEEFAIAGTPIPEGHLDVRVQSSPHDAAVRITFRPIDRPPVGKWYLRLPMRISDWSSVPGEVVGISEVGGETLVEIRPGSALLRIPLAEETMVAGRSQS